MDVVSLCRRSRMYIPLLLELLQALEAFAHLDPASPYHTEGITIEQLLVRIVCRSR
jgi:hypothetical protein